MLKMTIDNEEVVSDKDITINEEMLSASSTILNNVYPKEWEEDKDYTSRFYYPQDYSKALIQRSYVTQEAEAGTTIQVNGSATLTDVDTTKNSRVLRLLGQTSQFTTTGKNLLPNDTETKTINDITITKNSDGTYKVNGTATADVSEAICNNFIPMSGTWKLLGCPSGGSANTYMLSAYVGYWGAGSPNIDTGNGTNITYTGNVKVRFYIKSGTTCNNLIFKPMLTTDTSATINDFEPYTGNQPSPSPNYPQPVNVVSGDNEINVTGKNLEQGMEQGGINESGTLYPSTTTIRSKNYDLVEPNTQYIISLNNEVVSFVVLEYDKNKSLLSYNIRTGAFTTSANTRYIKITKNTSIDSHIQLEKSSSATTYEPYIGNTYNIDLYNSANLFDKNTQDFSKGYYLDGNGAEQISANWGVYYIHVRPGEAYSIGGCQVNGGANFCWFTQNKTLISRIGQKQDRNNMVAPSNAYYLGLSIVWNTTSTAYDSEIMVNVGETALPYQAYSPIELCKIGTYQDYIYKDSDKWYLHKEIGKYTFTGNESFTLSQTANVFYLNNAYSNALIDDISIPLCTIFQGAVSRINASTVGNNANNSVCLDKGTNKRFYFKTDAYSTTSGLATGLSGKSIYWIYEIPTNTEITYQPLIEQLEALTSQ